MSRRSSLLKKILLGIVLYQGIVLSFFIRAFSNPPICDHFDAVIVFSGGKKRIKTASHLFKNCYAPFLYISGLDRQTTKKDMLASINCPEINHDHVIVDYAMNTRQNAEHVTKWVLDNHFQTLMLVTHAYHMPRALYELKSHLIEPSFIIHPILIHSDDEESYGIWMKEYLKFQYTFIRWMLRHNLTKTQ